MPTELPSSYKAGSLKELLSIALPLIISSSSQSLMHVVDRIFLMSHSRAEFSAAMPAGLTNWTIISFAFGTAMYTNVFVSQYIGANQKSKVTAVIWQGVYASLIVGGVLLISLPFAPFLFNLFGHDSNVQVFEVQYFSILCLGTTPLLIGTVLSGFFTGRGKNKIVMFVNLFAVGVNAVLDYLLIFGVGPFPELGIRGAAIGTIVAFTVTAIAYIIVIWKVAAADGFHFMRDCSFDRVLIWRMIRFGFPTGVQIFADGAGFTLVIIVVGKLGELPLAATNLAFNLNSLSFVPMIGLGVAVSTLVGRRVGENRPGLGIRTTWYAVGMTLVYMSLWMVGYLFFPNAIMTPYLMFAREADSPELRQLVVVLLWFVSLYALFDAFAIIFGNAIRGAGDTRFSMTVMTLSSLFFLAIPAGIITIYFDNNLYLCWAAATVYIMALGIVFYLRFQSKKWMSMKVIEEDLITEEPISVREVQVAKSSV